VIRRHDSGARARAVAAVSGARLAEAISAPHGEFVIDLSLNGRAERRCARRWNALEQPENHAADAPQETAFQRKAREGGDGTLEHVSINCDKRFPDNNNYQARHPSDFRSLFAPRFLPCVPASAATPESTASRFSPRARDPFIVSILTARCR
jgi:hypothetical protein